MNDQNNIANIRPVSSSTEFEIPFDIVELPSKGLVYPKGSKLHGKDSLEVQYLTATQEDILTSPNLIQTGKMIPALIKSVMRDRTIDVNELILGDRNTILIWLRSTGYGADYPVRLQCSECNAQYEYEFDLSAFDIKTLAVTPDENGYFSFTLPVTKKEIKFRFMTGKDESEIANAISSRRKKLKSQIDPSLTMKMQKLIQSIDGNEDKGDIRKFIAMMPVKDSKAFRQYLLEIEPGVEMKQDAVCSSCGEVTEEVVPIQPNFFWPDS